MEPMAEKTLLTMKLLPTVLEALTEFDVVFEPE
jgi:hypothetical protein